jgi:hypothetical protein
MKLHEVTLQKKMILEYDIVLYRSSKNTVFYEAKIEFLSVFYEAEAGLNAGFIRGSPKTSVFTNLTSNLHRFYMKLIWKLYRLSQNDLL